MVLGISRDFYGFYADSIYAIARICHGNSVCLSVCLSVCPSVTRVDQSKTVEARITQFSPYSTTSLQFFGGKFHREILTGSPEQGPQWRVGFVKKAIFRHLCSNISKTVQDTTKVTIDH